MSFVVGLAFYLLARTIMKRKGFGARQRIFYGLLSAFLPYVGIPLALLRRSKVEKARQQKVRDMLKEQTSEVSRLRRRVERLERLRDVALTLEEGKVLPTLSAAIGERLGQRSESVRDDLRTEYELLGRIERERGLTGADRFVFIRLVYDRPDGVPRFGLPYDLDPVLKRDLMMMISMKYGVDMNDRERFFDSEHRQYDNKNLPKGVSLLVFDRKENELSRFGVELSGEQFERVVRCRKDFKEALANMYGISEAEYAEANDHLTLDIISKDKVGLVINGVTVAYAIAGEDGKVRSTGNGVNPTDRHGIHMASRFNEYFKGTVTMDEWIGKAVDLCMSGENLWAVRKSLDREQGLMETARRKENIRRNILHPAEGLNDDSLFKGRSVRR